MHVSSTEPVAFHQMGDLSTLPEKYGCDFLWWHKGWCGVQRKEVKDLIASVNDGRLGKEIHQMDPLVHGLLIVEGAVDYLGDMVVVGRAQMRRDHWDAVLWGVQDKGIKVSYTTGMDGTRRMVQQYHDWTIKEKHTALGRTRDAVPRTSWGTVDSRAYQVHLLTGLPGVGEETAAKLLDHFGTVPWTWTVTEEELCQVDGIGKVKAKRMMGAINGSK